MSCSHCGMSCACGANEIIAELEAKLAERDVTIKVLREDSAELRDEGNMTAAEYLYDWWGDSNVQGVAEMSGEEMLEIVALIGNGSGPLLEDKADE